MPAPVYFKNVPLVSIPQNPVYQGQQQISNVTNLEVGTGGKVMRSDQQGLWLGAEKFSEAPFTVDMDGNMNASNAVITGTIATGSTGKRIVLDGSDDSLKIYDQSNNLVGTIYGDSSRVIFGRNDTATAGGMYIDANATVIYSPNDGELVLSSSDSSLNHNLFTMNSLGIDFFDTAPPAPQQVISGSRGGNVALANLLDGLASYGLIVDSTTP